MNEPLPKSQKEVFQGKSGNFNRSYPQPPRKIFQSKWVSYLSYRGPYYPPRRYQNSSLTRYMSSSKRENKSNSSKSMNHKHISSPLHGHNLHASSDVYYQCGALGHVNYVCPLRRGIDGLNVVWIKKDVLKSLTNHSKSKNIWVP